MLPDADAVLAQMRARRAAATSRDGGAADTGSPDAGPSEAGSSTTSSWMPYIPPLATGGSVASPTVVPAPDTVPGPPEPSPPEPSPPTVVEAPALPRHPRPAPRVESAEVPADDRPRPGGPAGPDLPAARTPAATADDGTTDEHEAPEVPLPRRSTGGFAPVPTAPPPPPAAPLDPRCEEPAPMPAPVLLVEPASPDRPGTTTVTTTTTLTSTTTVTTTGQPVAGGLDGDTVTLAAAEPPSGWQTGQFAMNRVLVGLRRMN